jgi:HlyD family secretion protein
MRTLRIFLYSALIASACGTNANELAPEKAPLLTVETATFQSKLSLSGSLVAETSTSISAPGDGYGLAIRWMADNGSYVKKGEKVIEMDTSAVVSQIDSLKSAVISANNALAQQQSTDQINRAEKTHLLRQAEFNLRKAQADAGVPQDAYPKRVYDDMQLALGRSKVEHTNAVEALAIEKKIGKSGLAQKRIELERAKRDLARVYEQLEGYVLKAPRDGLLVASMNWREGRAYRMGDKTWPGRPIVEIPDLSVMTIKAELSDVDDGQAHLGMKAECRLDAYPEELLTGRVVSISPVARTARRNSLRRVFDVTVELDSTDATRMRPGMSARVDLMGAPREDVLVAPRRALSFDEGGVTARLASGKTTSVTLGPCNAHQCVIETGLSAGTQLGNGVGR